MPVTGPLQAVLFDLGFTLINFAGDFHAVMNASYLVLADSLRNAGFTFPTPEFADRFHAVISQYYRARESDLIERPVELYLLQVLASYGITDPPPDLVQHALQDMYSMTESYWRLENDALPVLKELKSGGYRMGLISNGANADNTNRLIDRFGLRGYFEVVLISAVVKIRKPDVRIYKSAVADLSLPASSIVMVGDTLTADILGAQRAGLRTVWITRRADRSENTRVQDSIIPDATINFLAELPLTLQHFPM